MKLPRKIKRYCPSCNAHTEQKADIVSTGHKRGTLKYGSLWRAKKRGALPGTGNKGRYSRRAVKSRKMKTKTTTKKVIIFTCQKCKKSNLAKSRRVGKIMFE
jgi:large subunit ribosomal protein L44e